MPVKAIVNPLRGVSADAAYVASAIDQIDGPVLAVGHSYGGAVITNATTNSKNVVGLVYVAAFAPDEGETLGPIIGSSKDSKLLAAVQETRFPTGNGSDTAAEVSIDAAKFHEVFTADLSPEESDVLAVSQRPIAGPRLRREVRPAGVEEPLVVGGRRAPVTRRSARTPCGRWRNAPARHHRG